MLDQLLRYKYDEYKMVRNYAESDTEQENTVREDPTQDNGKLFCTSLSYI